jgi:large subunit ribosomal protein L3
MKFILGQKIGMSQVFDEKGKAIPVTLITAGPCEVLEIKKNEEKDSYTAIQIGFLKLKEKKIKKTQKGKPYRYLKEFRGRKIDLKKGEKINVSIFKEGDIVKVSGLSKGKGFAGAVKRWGFAGMPATHGTKHHERTLGSVGSRFPQRVRKGRKMPGRMGQERITVKNLKVVKVDPENNMLAVKGALPGRKGTLLEIRGK